MLRSGQVKEIANEILNANIRNITINSFEFEVIKGHNVSINNQKGTLRNSNFFGSNLEIKVNNENVNIPISIQLYINNRNHYRIFVFNSSGMLTSINLSNGYEDGIVTLKTQLKLASTKMSKQDRAYKRDLMVCDIERAGVNIEGNNIVYFGQYDVKNNKFIDTNPDKFLNDLIVTAIIKGHYMGNKGYEIKELEYEIIQTEDDIELDGTYIVPKCNKCDYETVISSGYCMGDCYLEGFLQSNYVKEEKEILELIKENPNYEVSFDSHYSKCNKCGDFNTMHLVEILHGNKLVFKTEHKCNKCNGEYKKISFEDVKNGKCPRCNSDIRIFDATLI